MVEQLWMSGVVMAFLSFGIKTGMGIGAQVFNPFVSRTRGVAFFLGAFLIYLLLFGLVFVTVTQLNLMAYLDRIMGLIQYGMALHLAVALGLLVWGMRMVLKPARLGTGKPWAGLFLVMPCPVCATVILLNLTLALTLSVLTPIKTTVLLFCLFWAIVGLTLAALALFRGKTGIDNEFLGGAMALIGLYFLSTILIAPIYPKIKPAFSMAVSNTPTGQMDLSATLILMGITLVLASIGFVRVFFKKGDIL